MSSENEDRLMMTSFGDDDDTLRTPTKEMNTGWGFASFISHRDLYAGNYLMNDKIVFCISDITTEEFPY